MDTFINANAKLIDIKSKHGRDNLTSMVDYLCSSIVPDELPPLNKLQNETMMECHEYVSSFLYTPENVARINAVLQKRTKISDYDSIDGFSSVYDLNRDYLVEVSSSHFFESVGSLEHEMIHILPALSNNNPEEQYNEMLSIFGELLALELLSKKYNDNDIYMNNLITRCIRRMSYRVRGSDFEDEVVENQPDYMTRIYFSAYDYMLGFIYAIRLLDIYHQDSSKLIADFNLVLSGKIPVKYLLSEYHISLEDNDTVSCFMNLVDSYREWVERKYGTAVHIVK